MSKVERYLFREAPVREVCALKGILVGNVVLQSLMCVCLQYAVVVMSGGLIWWGVQVK